MANVTVANTTVTDSLVVKPGATVDLGGNRLQNVVAGDQATDGANVGQLRAVEKMARQQGAIAAAAVSIPLPSGGAIGETTVGAGLGSSGGYAALAIGVSSRIKEDLILKGTMGISGGTKTIGVGISYTFK
jgi:trimeric autotransporter adhesin